MVMTMISVSAQPIRLYSIGNSLTWDSKPPLVRDVLLTEGNTVTQGYHITCGLNLAKIVSDPTNVCIAPSIVHGVWTNALSNFEWDVITLQAFPGGTGLSEVTAAKTLIEQAIAGGRNKKCRFYLLLAWPPQSKSETFAEQLQRNSGGDAAKVFLSSSFLDYWFDAMVTAFPELDIRVIPTGKIFATIDNKLREINIGSFTNTYALYRDSYHMKPEGQHIASMALLSAVSGIRPGAHKFPPAYAPVLSSMNTNLVELVHEVIWSALTSDPRCKVTARPELNLRFNKLGSVHECSFIGTLHQSSDLNNWAELKDAKSPHRLTASERLQFFRTESH
jgi:hypothetical protein